jgi:hypothetical protein
MFIGTRVVPCLFVLADPAVTCCADGKPDDYLTKDGKLLNKLEVKEVQGGVVGFTGHLWRSSRMAGGASSECPARKSNWREKGS